MTTILFAAQQAGTATALTPVAQKLLSDNNKLHFAASSPAVHIWTQNAISCRQINGEHLVLQKLFDLTQPDIIVTGATVKSNIERRLWSEAQKRGIPSIAVLDSWTNISPRFRVNNDLYVIPTAILTIDQTMKAELQANARIKSRVYVTGQPYIESTLNSYKPSTVPPPTTFVFFAGGQLPQGAEHTGLGPVLEAIKVLLKSIAGHKKVRLLIKPHPSDNRHAWMGWYRQQSGPDQTLLSITDAPVESLLSSVHGVIGLTSITLVIAGLMGLPVLSLQTAGAASSNRKLEEMKNIYFARSPDAIGEGVKFLVNHKGAPLMNRDSLADFAASTDRTIDAIKKELCLWRHI